MSRTSSTSRRATRSRRTCSGGKGANLAEMVRLGLPVPPGFTISTEACRAYLRAGEVPEGLDAEIAEHLEALEAVRGKKLGDPGDPLLVSVRSGAKFSMPGMMETVLNIGLNDASVHGLAAQSDNPRFAWDSYRRLIQMFGRTVQHIDGERFERVLEELKARKGVTGDLDLDAADLQRLVEAFKQIVAEETGAGFPQDPREQMTQAIHAVFSSWNSDRAVLYRRQERIPNDLGTAVNVVAMVFGNTGPDSGTGVCFTRDLIPPTSSTGSGWTTSPAHRSASPSPGSRPAAWCSAERAPARRRDGGVGAVTMTIGVFGLCSATFAAVRHEVGLLTLQAEHERFQVQGDGAWRSRCQRHRVLRRLQCPEPSS